MIQKIIRGKNFNQRVWININDKFLKQNVEFYKKQIGENKKLAVVLKANSYGHGDILIGKYCDNLGIDLICTNSLFEAQRIRNSGIKTDTYIMGFIPFNLLKDAQQLENNSFALHSFEQLGALKSLRGKSRVQIKINSGLNRLGFIQEELQELVRQLAQNRDKIEVIGIKSHLASALNKNDPIYIYQREKFKEAVQFLENKGIEFQYKHIQKSGSILVIDQNEEEQKWGNQNDTNRLGISLYGLWACQQTRQNYLQNQREVHEPLNQIIKIQSRIESVYKEQNNYFGILPFGYNDQIGQLEWVLIQNKPFRVIKQYSNSTLIQIDENVKLNQIVEIIGDQNQINSVEEVAKWNQTINYEVTTRLNQPLFYQVGENLQFVHELEINEDLGYQNVEYNACLNYSRKNIQNFFTQNLLDGTDILLRINSLALVYRDKEIIQFVLQKFSSHIKGVVLQDLLTSEFFLKNKDFLQNNQILIIDTVESYSYQNNAILKTQINQPNVALIVQTQQQLQDIIQLQKIPQFKCQIHINLSKFNLIEQQIKDLEIKGFISDDASLPRAYQEQAQKINYLYSLKEEQIQLGEIELINLKNFNINQNRLEKLQKEAQKAVNFVSSVAQINYIKKGQKVGYDWTYEFQEDGIIAVVPVGYFDGFSRKHSNNGLVIIDQVKCPIVGRIYMNFQSVDISNHPRKHLIKPGHQVTLYGPDQFDTENLITQEEFSRTKMEKNLSSINFRLKRNLVD